MCERVTVRPVELLARITAATLVLIRSVLPVGNATANPTHPGKWTTPHQWGGTAVNLILLPGAPASTHSRVMWCTATSVKERAKRRVPAASAAGLVGTS